MPDHSDRDDAVSRAIPTEGDEAPEAGAEPPEQRVHDYAIDTFGRRYPVDIYGDRVIPNNRRPAGVPTQIWERQIS